MIGLMTARPWSMAVAICPAAQSAQRLSAVMTSSSTQESIRVAGRMAAGLLATQQRHDLVGGHARHIPPGGGVPQPPGQPLPSAFGSLTPDDLQCAVDLDDLDFVARVQPVFGSQVRGDGQLALAVQHHSHLQALYPVLRLLRNSIREYSLHLPERPVLRDRGGPHTGLMKWCRLPMVPRRGRYG